MEELPKEWHEQKAGMPKLIDDIKTALEGHSINLCYIAIEAMHSVEVKI
jgi:hypothetical protein